MAERTKRRKLNFEKCEYCRKDKQKCTPTTRAWPAQKCDWCSKQGLPCGQNSLPDRFKHRNQHGAPQSEPSGSWKLPISMVPHGIKQQDFSQVFHPEQPIQEQYSSRNDFLLQTLDGAMLNNYPEILASVIQNHLIDIDSKYLQEYVVKIVDWALMNDDDGLIKAIILYCPKSAFEHTIEKRGVELVDWANCDGLSHDIFQALLHWEIVYGRKNSSIVLLRAIEERHPRVGVEVAKLLLRFSGTGEQFADMYRQGRESHTSSSTSDHGSSQEDGDDYESGHTHQLDDLRMKVIERGDCAKLPLPPMTIPAGYLLHVAIHSGQLEAAKQLLCSAKSGGISQDSTTLNYKNSEDHTPLMAAISCDNKLELINLLLEQHGIDINVRNDSDETALGEAILRGDHDVVRSLVRHPAVEINVEIDARKTPLMYAVAWCDVQIVTDLLHHSGLDVNAQDDFGKTGLHYAMKNWQICPSSDATHVVLLLLQNSRTLRLPDDRGNFPDVSYFLQKHFWNRDVPGNLWHWST